MREDENVYDSGDTRRTRRRKQAVAGVAGLAVLGAGAFLVTSQLADNTKTEVADSAAMPVAVPATGAASASASPTGSSSASPAASTSSSPAAGTESQKPVTTEDRAKAAREANKQNGTEVRRLLPAAQGANAAAVEATVKLKTYGTVHEDKQTMRVYSAAADLTGYKELAWVADEGEETGDARCSQRIRLSDNTEAKVRPTLLICWRTSEKKSAYTVLVNLNGKPSKQKSLAAINKAWAKIE